MKINSQKKLGFSLLEISITSLIVAVLLALVFEGSQIVEQSRITTARSLTKSSPIAGMSDLVVWYESTMAESFDDENLVSGYEVDTWHNINPAKKSSPTPNDAAVGGANSPTYITNTINNLPAVSFDNALSQYFTFDGTSLANSDYTVIVVEQRRKGGISNYFISGNSNVANQNLSLGYKIPTQIHFAQFSNNYVITVPNFSASLTIPRIHIFRFSSNASPCKEYHSYQNGGIINGSNPQTLTSDGSTDMCQGLIAYNSATIGAFSNTNFYKGDIGEIIIFNKYINDDERRSVELYLSKKWGIDLN
jgi:prepilin-type N-terminal cleavage/methylation domain-containing protein